MKKLVAILVILGLVGVANAGWVETFEGYNDGDPVAGTNGWVVGGIDSGGFTTTGFSVTAGIGVGSSNAVRRTNTSWGDGDHQVLSQNSGTYAVNWLVNCDTNGNRGTITLSKSAPGSAAEAVMLDYNGKWYFATKIADAWTTIADHSHFSGWAELELGVDLDVKSAYAKIRDTDANGVPTGAWQTIGTVAAGGTSVDSLAYHSIGGHTSTIFDGLPEPMTLSVLALGGLGVLLRRRR